MRTKFRFVSNSRSPGSAHSDHRSQRLIKTAASVLLPAARHSAWRVDIHTWFGLLGPARLPAELTQRLNKAFVDALNSPELRARLATLLAEPMSSTPAQFAEFVKGELAKYETVVKASGARVE